MSRCSALPRRLGGAAAAATMTGALCVLTAGPALAADTFVEVNPSTAQAGSRVNLRASCGDNNNRQADVQSEAFGRMMLRPDNGFLTGSVTIPGSKAAGDYPVNLTCQNNNTASTTLTVVTMSQPAKGPATGGGGTADGSNTLLLAGGITATALVVAFGAYRAQRRRTDG